jgi:hypothetical protein
MDFAQALAAHDAWKRKLARYLKQRDDSFKAAEIGLDSRCPLGQWIYGEGSKYVTLVEYSTLRAEHARFHRAAADVVRRANAGQTVDAEIALGSHSEFGRASLAVVSAIMAMQKVTISVLVK